MTTLKKKIETTMVKEVEVKLPYYSKSKNGKVFYKVISADRVISINLYDFHTGIECTCSVELAFNDNCVDSERYEFNEAYVKAISRIDEIYTEN